MVHRLRRIFRPHAAIAEALQREFRLPRPPACRMYRSRFEIVVRGAGLSRAPIEQCVTVADAMGAVARPLLARSHRFTARRSAAFAIRVSFEDEHVVETGIATTRISYVALHDSGRAPRLRRTPHGD